MTSPLRKSATALALLLAFGAASANEYAPLMKAKKFAEAEKMASTRLAQDPSNAEAMSAKVDAILAVGGEGRIEEAVKLTEQCVAANPSSAICHLAHGKALGSKAMAGGMMSAVGYAGKIRDAFKKAVELDPKNTEARFALLQFYMMAPGFMGGGTSKSEALVTQTMALNPEAGKLMTALIDVSEGRMAKAETAAASARPGSDEELQDQHESLFLNMAAKQINDKKFTEAERLAREGLKHYPDSEDLAFAIARTQQEQGKHREALASFEQLLTRSPHARIHFRMAQCLQALGDKARATASYEKALAFKPGLQKKQRAEAEDQLKALKG